MFDIIEVSNSELQLSILEAFYITKYQTTFCKQKDFYNLFVEKRKISYFGLARNLIQHWISPNHWTFISG